DLAEQDEEAPLRRELREREQALLEGFAATWTEPLRAMGLHCYRHPFRRGMIECIPPNPEDLLAHADALFRQFPLQAMWLQSHAAGRTVTPAAWPFPQLPRLRNLELYVGAEEVPGGLGNALGAASSLANLSRLAVTDAGEHFSDSDATAVANAPHFSGLRVLQ